MDNRVEFVVHLVVLDRSIVCFQVSDGSRDRTRDPFNSKLLV